MLRRSGLRSFCVCLAIVMMACGGARAAVPPKIGHVFIIVLENEGYHITFGPASPAHYLKGLAERGAILPNYYGIGHFSLDNYLAMISGQPPNAQTQGDCQVFSAFRQTGVAADGVAVGAGCVYPAAVKTIADQLGAKGLAWKSYNEDMGNIPAREAAVCGHPVIGTRDGTQKAVPGDQYATRHDPFVYFHSIIDGAACQDVVGLGGLQDDLKSVASTPNLVYITPNLCNDGHDGGDDEKPCVDGAPGGLVSADKFLGRVVPEILASPAYRQDGLLVITFDEADIDVKVDHATHAMALGIGDASACCGEAAGPNFVAGGKIFGQLDDQGPGVAGPGGGRIGAVLVSRFIKPGTVSMTPYNHYSLLRSLEDMFGLDHLGDAAQDGLVPFGADVFTRS